MKIEGLRALISEAGRGKWIPSDDCDADGRLVCAAVNALPALLDVAALAAERHEDCQQARDHRANPRRSYPCTMCAALARLESL